MSSNKSTTSGGVGFFGLMFLIFLVLKLCEVIDWSWWWVTAPMWGPMALIVVGSIIAFPFILIHVSRKEKRIKRLRRAR